MYSLDDAIGDRYLTYAMKNNPHTKDRLTVVFLFQDPWNYSCGYAHNIAHEVAHYGKVIIFNPFVQYSLKQLIFDKRKRAEWLLPFTDRSVVYIPNMALLPFQRFVEIQQLNNVLSYWLFRIAYVLIAGFNHPILWYFAYQAIQYPDLLKFGCARVYDRPDHVASVDVSEDQIIKQFDKQLIIISTIVVVNSRVSYRYVRSFTLRVVQAPWGLDSLFLQAKHNKTALLQHFSHPRLGMIGSIDHRLNMDIIYKLAQARPRWNIIFIGSLCGYTSLQSIARKFPVSWHRLLSLANVHHVSEVPHDQIPAVINSLDIGLVLYDTHLEFVKGSNPIKMYEYMSMGIPVVSTPIPMAKLLAPYVKTAKNAHLFVEKIESVMRNSPRHRFVGARKVSARYTWAKHVNAIIRRISYI